jgi:BREX system ATP-binding protein BrxC/D
MSTKTLDKDLSWTLLNALRNGTVPDMGTEEIAVGLDDQLKAIEEGLDHVARGRSAYKFLRGDYGAGKTFLSSLVASRAAERGFLFSKVVVSAADTPLYQLLSIYRRLCEGLSRNTRKPGGQFRSILDRWLYLLEEKVVELNGMEEDDDGFADAVSAQVDRELLTLGDTAGRMAACIKGYHQAQMAGDYSQAGALLDWMSGEDKVAASMKKLAGVTGKLSNQDVFAFLQGLLQIIRSTGEHKGLVVVIDEVETILRLRRPERTKSLEVLRQLVDACDRHEFPGLYILYTGTPDFFDSPQGVPALPPLHDRIKVAFDDNIPDNLRQPQIRLRAFNQERLQAVARKVRQVYPSTKALDQVVTDEVINALSDAMTAGFGGRIEVIPRMFLRAWVDLLDRADQHADFDPLAFLQERGMVAMSQEELTDVEREHWDQAQVVEI